MGYVCRRYKRTVQQVQRYSVQVDSIRSSCKSSTWPDLTPQLRRCYGRLLLETLTVHRGTSCRMSIRL